VVGQRHAPAALPPGKARYPFYKRLGGPQSRYGQVRKISPLPGFDPRTFQPVASRYTDYVIPAAIYVCVCVCVCRFVERLIIAVSCSSPSTRVLPVFSLPFRRVTVRFPPFLVATAAISRASCCVTFFGHVHAASLSFFVLYKIEYCVGLLSFPLIAWLKIFPSFMTLSVTSKPRSRGYIFQMPIQVAMRSEPSICGRTIAGIMFANHAEGKDVRLLCLLCRWRSLPRAHHSLREVIERACVSMCIIVCDLETWNTGRPRSNLKHSATKNTF